MIRLLLPSMVLIASLCGSASAMTVTVPLPELVGEVPYSPSTGGREVEFDSHQQFSSIENVSIEIEAHVHAMQFDACGTHTNPQPCDRRILLLGFSAVLNRQDSTGPGFTLARLFSEDSQSLEAYGLDTAPFRNPRLGWGFLLEGRGSLTLSGDRALFVPDLIIRNVQNPSGEILSARLIIEGTPIPEPSSGLLIAIGLSTLSLCRNSRSVDHKR